ncbi:unannotated protein [freshwater metagenome]|uniref:Unannotated protein n=1 Tax=freshwater metagenome TaxID=449393 RepID=A0A6J6XQI4_9ZZZZ
MTASLRVNGTAAASVNSHEGTLSPRTAITVGFAAPLPVEPVAPGTPPRTLGAAFASGTATTKNVNAAVAMNAAPK